MGVGLKVQIPVQRQHSGIAEKERFWGAKRNMDTQWSHSKMSSIRKANEGIDS